MLNNGRIYHCCWITPTIIIVILLLLTVFDDCFANISGIRHQQTDGGILSRLLRNNDGKANNNNNNNGGKVGTYSSINPVTIGIQRALSRRPNFGGSNGGQVNAKLQSSGSIKMAAAADTSSSPSLSSTNDEESYESPAIRFAFIDYSKESTDDIKLTMQPHLTSSMNDETAVQPVLRMATRAIPSKQCVAPRARGGGAAAAAVVGARPLLFWESMISGAVSRSIAQTTMHPANTMKTMMQSSLGPNKLTLKDLVKPQMFRRLSVGAGANFVLSLPHGALNFAVLEAVRGRMTSLVGSVPSLDRNKERMGPGLDFLSSAIATICCSVVSTPQMMITDNIMAGNYPNLFSATGGLYSDRGMLGFYTGWWPGLVGKIPSYALTWTFFQQMKRVRNMMSDRPAKNYENTIMGCIASATCVCIMIPMDTIKTRLVTQTSAMVLQSGMTPYKGIIDCAVRITREEGIKTFYRGLAPRLLSVVPMIGIQFGVYEAMKKVMLQRSLAATQTYAPMQQPGRNRGITTKKKKNDSEVLIDRYGIEEVIEEAAMETSASASTPFAAPHFLKKRNEDTK